MHLLKLMSTKLDKSKEKDPDEPETRAKEVNYSAVLKKYKEDFKSF